MPVDGCGRHTRTGRTTGAIWSYSLRPPRNTTTSPFTFGTGAGANQRFDPRASELIEGIAATINTKPEEQWLVILHKEDEWHCFGQKGIPDLTKHINDLVQNPNNVHFLTWGNEKSTNEFCEVKNVILAGTLFYPKSVYEVRARASKGLESAEELDL